MNQCLTALAIRDFMDHTIADDAHGHAQTATDAICLEPLRPRRITVHFYQSVDCPLFFHFLLQGPYYEEKEMAGIRSHQCRTAEGF